MKKYEDIRDQVIDESDCDLECAVAALEDGEYLGRLFDLDPLDPDNAESVKAHEEAQAIAERIVAEIASIIEARKAQKGFRVSYSDGALQNIIKEAVPCNRYDYVDYVCGGIQYDDDGIIDGEKSRRARVKWFATKTEGFTLPGRVFIADDERLGEATAFETLEDFRAFLQSMQWEDEGDYHAFWCALEGEVESGDWGVYSSASGERYRLWKADPITQGACEPIRG